MVFKHTIYHAKPWLLAFSLTLPFRPSRGLQALGKGKGSPVSGLTISHSSCTLQPYSLPPWLGPTSSGGREVLTPGGGMLSLWPTREAKCVRGCTRGRSEISFLQFLSPRPSLQHPSCSSLRQPEGASGTQKTRDPRVAAAA